MQPLEQVGKYVDHTPAAAAEPELAPGLKLVVTVGLGLFAWAIPLAVLYLLW